MPPEMFRENVSFGSPADMWSLGVIIFSLACGTLPFGGSNVDLSIRLKHIMEPEKVMHSRFMAMPKFCSLTSPLQHLLFSLLRVDPKDRNTAKQALHHPWIEFHRHAASEHTTNAIAIPDLRKMAAYGKRKILTKLTLMHAGMHLTQLDLHNIQSSFIDLDADNSGTISREQFHSHFCKSVGHTVPIDITNLLFEIIDTNENGEIDYSEYRACFMPQLSTEQIKKAFDHFDQNQTGYITKFDLFHYF